MQSFTKKKCMQSISKTKIHQIYTSVEMGVQIPPNRSRVPRTTSHVQSQLLAPLQSSSIFDIISSQTKCLLYYIIAQAWATRCNITMSNYSAHESYFQSIWRRVQQTITMRKPISERILRQCTAKKMNNKPLRREETTHKEGTANP